jgi:hypothetical protein
LVNIGGAPRFQSPAAIAETKVAAILEDGGLFDLPSG